MLKLVRFAGLMIGAMNFGLAFAHLTEMGPKRAMSGAEWLTTQQAYRDFGKVSRVTIPAALLSTLATLLLVRLHRPAALWTALGAISSTVPVVIWARFNEPVNHEIVTRRADALPANWPERRDQWEYAHATSAAFHALSLGALIAAALQDERADSS